MDTVEELKGTYFFNGMINLNAGEPFFYIFWRRLRKILVLKIL